MGNKIRLAYRKQALLHHPDKNPDRVEEATERFKHIGEAYSVLRDPQQRAAYDTSYSRVSNSGNSVRPKPSDDDFNDNNARNLFREVFGDDFVNKLAMAAAAGIERSANRLSKTRVVRGAVGAHLCERTNVALAGAELAARQEETLRSAYDVCVEETRSHEHFVAELELARKNRTVGFFRAFRWWETEDELNDRALDRETAAATRKLNAKLRSAESDWRRAKVRLTEAEAKVCKALNEAEVAESQGASLEQSVNAGAFLLGRLAERLQQR